MTVIELKELLERSLDLVSMELEDDEAPSPEEHLVLARLSDSYIKVLTYIRDSNLVP